MALIISVFALWVTSAGPVRLKVLMTNECVSSPRWSGQSQTHTRPPFSVCLFHWDGSHRRPKLHTCLKGRSSPPRPAAPLCACRCSVSGGSLAQAPPHAVCSSPSLLRDNCAAEAWPASRPWRPLQPRASPPRCRDILAAFPVAAPQTCAWECVRLLKPKVRRAALTSVGYLWGKHSLGPTKWIS